MHKNINNKENWLDSVIPLTPSMRYWERVQETASRIIVLDSNEVAL